MTCLCVLQYTPTTVQFSSYLPGKEAAGAAVAAGVSFLTSGGLSSLDVRLWSFWVLSPLAVACSAIILPSPVHNTAAYNGDARDIQKLIFAFVTRFYILAFQDHHSDHVDYKETQR